MKEIVAKYKKKKNKKIDPSLSVEENNINHCLTLLTTNSLK